MGLIDHIQYGDSLFVIHETGYGMVSVTKVDMSDEFHVHTPKDDGGKKKDLKYSWMKDKKDGDWSLVDVQGNSYPPKSNTNKSGKKKGGSKSPPRKILDAIFIAPTLVEGLLYAKLLNYKSRNCLFLRISNYDQKLQGYEPDEDVPVHLCGSWIADNLDQDTFWELEDCRMYLKTRNFDYVEVPEIGKTDS